MQIKKLEKIQLGKLYGPYKVLRRLSYTYFKVRCNSCNSKIKITAKALRFRISNKGAGCVCSRILKMRKNALKHGCIESRFYTCWSNMKKRCYSPKCSHYYLYGARGIKVCKRWHTFENFKLDMYSTYNDSLTLERIDNNKGYCPKNCKWIPKVEQYKNTRRNIRLTHKGVTMCITDWARKLNICPVTLIGRYRRGLPVDRILLPENNMGRRRLVIDGVENSIASWARIAKCASSRITSRLKKGWSVKEAVFGEKRVNQFC